MLIERSSSSRPNSPEEPTPLVEGSHTMDRASGAPFVAHLVPPATREVSTTATSSHQQPFIFTGQQYPVEIITQHLPSQPAAYRSGYPQPPPVRLYEHPHPHQPLPTAIYTTPPLPSLNPVRIPTAVVEEHPGSTPPAPPVQVPNLQPLTVYTGNQPCTAFTPPCDVRKYGKAFKGLLMTVDGTVGGRKSPIPGTEASPRGVGQADRPKTPQTRRKRSHDDDEGSRSVKKARFSFTIAMLEVLEQRFAQGRYIAADERRILAAKLGIADVQVKNWFQNRRMKWKRQCASHQLPPNLNSKTKHPPEIPHAISTLSVAGNFQQSGKQQPVTCPAPPYTTTLPYTASSCDSQRTSPKELASTSGLSVVHPSVMAYPQGFAYTMPFPGAGGGGYGYPVYVPSSSQEEKNSKAT